jgi:hypothetical protein
MPFFQKQISLLLIFAFLFSLPIKLSAASENPVDRMTFFGDSTTAHLALRGGIPKERVWSGAGSTVLFQTVFVCCAGVAITGEAVHFPADKEVKLTFCRIADHLLKLGALVRGAGHGAVCVFSYDVYSVLFTILTDFKELLFYGCVFLVVA